MFTLSDLAMLLFIAAWGIIILTIVILIWLFRTMRGLPLWVRLIPTALVLSFFVLPAIWEDYKEHLDEEKDWAEYREYRANTVPYSTNAAKMPAKLSIKPCKTWKALPCLKYGAIRPITTRILK